jgi:hypothetical protein
VEEEVKKAAGGEGDDWTVFAILQMELEHEPRRCKHCDTALDRGHSREARQTRRKRLGLWRKTMKRRISRDCERDRERDREAERETETEAAREG